MNRIFKKNIARPNQKDDSISDLPYSIIKESLQDHFISILFDSFIIINDHEKYF